MKLFNINKKIIIFLQVLSFSLFIVSCSNEETTPTDDPTPIVFGAKTLSVIGSQDTPARASIDKKNPTMTSLDDMMNSGKDMLIYGIRYDVTTNPPETPNWSLPLPVSQRFMDGVRGSVTKDVNDVYWIDYPTEYYMPGTYHKYDFKFFFPAPSQGGDPSGVTFLEPTGGDKPIRLRIDTSKNPDVIVASIDGASKQLNDLPLPVNMERLLTSVVLEIEKVENPAKPLDHKVFINKLTVSGITRGTYDVVNEAFDPFEMNIADPMADATVGTVILEPGYNTDDKYLVPDFGALDDDKYLAELLLFPVKHDASTVEADLERYFFELWLNERKYTFTLPMSTDPSWEGWVPEKQYTYTIRVEEADIYVVPKGGITQEPWKPGNNPEGKPGEIIIGG